MLYAIYDWENSLYPERSHYFNRRRLVISKNIPSGAARVALVLVWCCSIVRGADWPCYRGPNKDGRTSERIESWPPREIWRASVGQGYSGITVSDGRVYTMGWAGGQDTVYCFDESSTGNNPIPIWRQSYSCGSVAYEGTRATPTIDADEVYTFSHEGRLSCFNRVDGTPLWNKSVTGGRPGWGYGSSVLIEGDLAIVNAKRYGVAVYKTHPGTHAFAWETPNNSAGYATPFAFTRGTDRTVVVFGGYYAAGLNPANGSVRWYFGWSQGMADPIIHDDKLWVSTGYGVGCAVVKLGSGALAVNEAGEWQSSSVMKNKENCSVLHEGYVYGISEGGGLRCVEFATGTLKWKSTDYGANFGTESAVMLADNQLVVMNGADAGANDGDLVVVEAKPTTYTEVHRANDILSGDTWTVPTLANGILYLRNHEGTVVAYSVLPPPVPEMDVERDGVPVADASIDVVAQSEPGVAQRLTFDIRNTGTANLTVGYSRTPIVGWVNCETSIQQAPASSVTPDNATALVVDVTPSLPGRWSFDVRLTTNDDDENPYTWTAEGMANDDWDGDGMKDTWEISHFGSTNAALGAPLEDWDLDGFLNLHEYEAGTDPTNALSLLIATEVTPSTGNGIVVAWQSAPNRHYAVRCWTNLLAASTVVASNIPATPPINRHTNDSPRPRGYYRVELE